MGLYQALISIRNLTIFLIIVLFTPLFLIPCFAYDNKYVHPYIAEQGLLLLPSSLRTEIAQHLGSFHGEKDCNAAHYGTTITEGAYDEDVYNPREDECSYNPLTYYNYHFYDADNGSSNNGLSGSEGAPTQASWYFDKAKQLFQESKTGEAFWYLGRVGHLLADAAVPAHVHLDPHGLAKVPGFDSYEEYMTSHYFEWSYAHSTSLPSIPYSWSLYSLFAELAQRTQYFPSDDVDGNDVNLNADTTSWPQNVNEWRKYSYLAEEWYIEETNLQRQGDYLMPLAFQYTSALYKLFWHETHRATNPTVSQESNPVTPGSYINQSGSGFTGAATATLHFRKPDGTEYPTQKVDITNTGEFNTGYWIPLSKVPGNYI